jgi:hypothetical protein
MTDEEASKLIDDDPVAYARDLLKTMVEGANESEGYASKVRAALMALSTEEKLDFLITAFVPMMLDRGEYILHQLELERQAAAQAPAQ